MTVARNIKFTTIELLPDRKMGSVLNCLDNIIALYNSRGFNVTNCLMDRELVPLMEDLLQRVIKGNMTSDDVHVPEVERQI